MAKIKKIFLLLALVAVLIILNIFLGNQNDIDKNNNDKQYNLQFLDHRNKVIKLDFLPQHVAAIETCAPVLYYAVDQTYKHLAIINAGTKSRLKATSYNDFLAGLMKIDCSAIKNEKIPNVEAIVNAKVDLAIQWYHDRSTKPLEAVGITTVGWKCCTKQDGIDHMKMVGYITGKVDRVQELRNMQIESSNQLRRALKNTQKVRILEFSAEDYKKLGVVTNDQWTDYEVSGVKNVAAQEKGWSRVVGYEQIIVWNPEIIFIRSSSKAKPEEYIQE